MLRWIEGWDSLATGDLNEKYDSVLGNSTITATARTGTAALNVADGSGAPHAVTKNFDSQGTWIVGFALRISTLSLANKELLRIMDGATTQITLSYQTGTGKLFLTGAFGTSALTTDGLSAAVWYFIELKAVIHNSTGAYELRVDGQTVLSASGIDTSSTANNSADRIRWSAGDSTGSSTSRQFDDVYVCDGQTGAGSNPCDDFLGDSKVECIRPNANGTTSDFDGSDGNSTDNYLLVDDTTADGDTTYVESSTLNEKDTYNYGALATTSGTVLGVQINPYVRKTDAGVRQIATVARESGGTEEDGPTQTLSTSYLVLPDVRDVDPDAADWSITSVNDAEFGMKVVA